jgi:FixJ family two-component response regulator
MDNPMNQPTDNPIVYVVDDDPDVREGLKHLLQSVGLKIKVFGSAAELLTNNFPQRVSCLVLDVRMPGLSGLTFKPSWLGPS